MKFIITASYKNINKIADGDCQGIEYINKAHPETAYNSCKICKKQKIQREFVPGKHICKECNRKLEHENI